MLYLDMSYIVLFQTLACFLLKSEYSYLPTNNNPRNINDQIFSIASFDIKLTILSKLLIFIRFVLKIPLTAISNKSLPKYLHEISLAFM